MRIGNINIFIIYLLSISRASFCSMEKIQPIIFQTSQGNTITIREVQEPDFEIIKELAVKVFSQAYNFTTAEETDVLRKSYNLIITDEANFYKEHGNSMIALVAIYNNNIIGYISANLTTRPGEIYERFLVVDSLLQHQGIGKKLMSYCFKLIPNTKRVVCLTNKKNTNTQKLYEYFGGKKVEHPSWTHYLYKNLNPNEYIGYELDEKAIERF